MTDHLVSPDHEIKVGDATHTLGGTFATLKAVQHAFKEDIVQLQARVLDMRTDEVALLIATASGGRADDIGQALLDEVGVTDRDYLLLKANLMAWLAVALAPKAKREEARKQMGELIGKLSASPGASTRSSPSAS